MSNHRGIGGDDDVRTYDDFLRHIKDRKEKNKKNE